MPNMIPRIHDNVTRTMYLDTSHPHVMKESAYSNATAPVDVHVFPCEKKPKQDAYRRDLIEQDRRFSPGTG